MSTFRDTLPDNSYYRHMAAGHYERHGHPLVAHLASEDEGQTWALVRECCDETEPPMEVLVDGQALRVRPIRISETVRGRVIERHSGPRPLVGAEGQPEGNQVSYPIRWCPVNPEAHSLEECMAHEGERQEGTP